jgi:hypothetical protein
MKHSVKLFALLAAVLCCLTACEKNQESSDKQRDITYTVSPGTQASRQHAAETAAHPVTVHLETEAEWQALLDRFCDWAEEGNKVTFYNGTQAASLRSIADKLSASQKSRAGSPRTNTKDATTFSTTDRGAMKRWMAQMEDEGMTVTVTFDSNTGTWNGTAYATAPQPEHTTDTTASLFSISASRQVCFARGNLQYRSASGSYRMAATQYDVLDEDTAGEWTDRFVQDTLRHLGDEWRLLSNAEARYMMEVRLCSAVGGVENARYARAKVVYVHGLLLFPDLFVWPDSVALPIGVNNNGISNTLGWDDNVYSLADWQRLEAAGVVFLPAANSYLYNMVEHADGRACYWTSTTGYAIVAAPDYVGTQDMGDFEQYPIRYVRDNL